MRRLLFNSTLLILAACGTSEDSVQDEHTVNTDSLMVITDSIPVIKDSLNRDIPPDDSIRVIEHGSPNQEVLDSIKRAKMEEKKKK